MHRDPDSHEHPESESESIIAPLQKCVDCGNPVLPDDKPCPYRPTLSQRLEKSNAELKRVRAECRAHHDAYTFLRASIERVLIEAEGVRKDLKA